MTDARWKKGDGGVDLVDQCNSYVMPALMYYIEMKCCMRLIFPWLPEADSRDARTE